MSEVTQSSIIQRINAALDRIEAARPQQQGIDLSQDLALCEAKYAALRAETQYTVAALDALIAQNAEGNR